ncbi:MAG: hypothetical protein ACK4RK_00575 [Gemmataceae bacterium]
MNPKRQANHGRSPFLWSVALLWAALLPAHAGPTEELLRLVPADVGFCLVVRDLRGHAETLADAPFVERLRAAPLAAVVTQTAEWQRFTELHRDIKTHLHIDARQLRDDILGDAVVMVYRPGPPDQPDHEQGLLLLHARRPELLDRLLTRLNDVQVQAGDIQEIQTRDFQGVRYVRRVKPNGESEYYCRRGPVLAFATREEMLRQVIDRLRASQDKDQPPPLAEKLRRLVGEKYLAALWINPRAFDAELAQNLEAAEGGEAAFLKTFLVYWKALEGAALFVRLDHDVQVGLAAQVQTETLPESARRFLATASQPSVLWGNIPDDALLTVSSRVDIAALVDLVREFLPPSARQAVRNAVERSAGAALGKDVGNDVVPALGPDWGLCLLPPTDDKAWIPQAWLALGVRPSDTEPPVGQALLTALNSLAMLAVFDYNHKHADAAMSLRSLRQEDVEIRYLVNDQRWPPGVQPAFALKQGYLLLANSPEAIRRFHAGATDPPAAAEVPLLRLSLRGLRLYLEQRRAQLIDHLMAREGLTKPGAELRLRLLLSGLQIFDRLEIQQHSQPGQVRFIARFGNLEP